MGYWHWSDPVTPTERAEIWEQIAAIRERNGDHVGSLKALATAMANREMVRTR